MSSAQAQPKIRLYSFASFDRSAKARWLLHELGLSFEDKRLNREERENENSDFLRMNPLGRVPVMEYGDSVFFESGAICAYLADSFPERGFAPPLNLPLRTQYLQWMFFASATIDTLQTRIMVIEDIPEGSEVRTTKEAALMSDWRDALEALERTLKKADFLVGNRLTAADICVSYHLHLCTLWPELEVHLKDFPKVGAYLERMKKQPVAVKAETFSRPG